MPRVLVLLVVLLAPSVGAVDLANGERLFRTYCAACHGGDPRQSNPATVAGVPGGVRSAIGRVSFMNGLLATLGEGGIADVQAYVDRANGFPVTIRPATGWYWNPAEPGRGYFLEARDDRVAFSAFLYADDGEPLWLLGFAPIADGKLATPLLRFRDGQALAAPWKPAVADGSPGALGIDLEADTRGRLTTPGGTIPIERIPATPGAPIAPPAPGYPENGWWWSEAEPGRGYTLEIQDRFLFLVAYLYDESGRPLWLVTQGTMAEPTRYEGRWLRFRGGQPLVGAFRPATAVVPDAGPVVLEFDAPTRGTLVLPDGRRVAITRFPF